MINVIYTKVGQPFKAWVGALVEERNQSMVRDNFIEMDPAFEEAFRARTHISSKYLILVF